jgi:cytochrome c oxidase subunit 1
MAVIYFYYPRVTGRPLNRALGYLHFWITMVVTFLGLGVRWVPYIPPTEVLPVRYVDYSSWKNGFGWPVWMWVTGVMLLLLIVAQVLFVFNLLFSLFRRRVGDVGRG